MPLDFIDTHLIANSHYLPSHFMGSVHLVLGNITEMSQVTMGHFNVFLCGFLPLFLYSSLLLIINSTFKIKIIREN